MSKQIYIDNLGLENMISGTINEAYMMKYSNSSSHLSADNVQAAIDAVNTKAGSKLDSANPTGTGSLSLNRKSGTTTGSYSVAIGQETTASAQAAFAEGRNTVASGTYAHAEGGGTTASANYSHAEGDTTTSSGVSSHSEGQGTIANHKSQHVFGEWNETDASTAAASARGNYVEIVGKGTSNGNRSNARTLDWSGNEVLAGGLKINGSEDVKAIKKETKTATTDSMGLISLGTYATARTALVACSSQAFSSGVYYLFQLFTFSGIWHARVTKSNDGAIVASTQITFDYYYIDAT